MHEHRRGGVCRVDHREHEHRALDVRTRNSNNVSQSLHTVGQALDLWNRHRSSVVVRHRAFGTILVQHRSIGLQAPQRLLARNLILLHLFNHHRRNPRIRHVELHQAHHFQPRRLDASIQHVQRRRLHERLVQIKHHHQAIMFQQRLRVRRRHLIRFKRHKPRRRGRSSVRPPLISRPLASVLFAFARRLRHRHQVQFPARPPLPILHLHHRALILPRHLRV